MQDRREVLDVLVLGVGNVGRELVRQIAGAGSRAPWLRIVGLAGRAGGWLAPKGLAPEDGEAAIAARHAGLPLDQWRPHARDAVFLPAGELYSPRLAGRLAALGMSGVAVADLTASRDLFPMHLALRRAGHHLVLANKWPLVVPYAQYVELWEAGEGFLKHETTVGAALPVIGPLEDLVATGDRVEEIVASISGTLGFLTTSLQQGTPFSGIVRQAEALGYTEPADPRLDLAGVDAARKALILARKIGQRIDLEDIEVESLVPEGLESVPLEEFHARLPESDERYRRRVDDARAGGNVLRYLATVRPEGRPSLRLVEVPLDSAFASTRGTESLFSFRTARYNDQPLVVRGQGAGGALTASGVLADILSIRAGLLRIY